MKRSGIGAVSVVVPIGAMLIGCGNAGPTAKVQTTEATTSGSAYMGSLASAAVSAYPLSPDGTAATVATKTTTTDGSGTFTLPQGAYVVHVSGGTYMEEATGVTDSMSGMDLRAAYTSGPTSVVVSPYSEAVVQTAQAMGSLTDANLGLARASITALLGGVDPMQTKPTYLQAGQALTTMTVGNQMAFALGAESELRSDYGIDAPSSVATIMAQAASGDTIANCNGGAGDPQPDGTILAPQGDNCALTIAAASYASNPANNSGITTIDAYVPAQAMANQYATASADACGDRIALLEQNRSLYDGRKADVQALLPQYGVTASNWSTVNTGAYWGPSKAAYGKLTAPATCTDKQLFKRELVMSIENYWIDQGINYCHHHIPGWTPPNTKTYRNTGDANSSTGGGSSDGLTCTAQRGADGSQQVQTDETTPAFPRSKVNWNGLDCSNFTAWVYDFAGLTGKSLQGSIAQQACTVDGTQPGVLLNINSTNIATMAQYLKPGDLLLVSQSAAQKAGPYTGDYQLAHVITWTGKHWSDLQAGADKDLYDLKKLGSVGSRLGGDFLQHDVSESDLSSDDVWMIIDSHYAGPAYRPFSLKTGWYSSDLVAVRRIIGADEARNDAVLSQYVLKQNTDDTKNQVTKNHVMTIHAQAGGTTLYYDTSNGYKCFQSRGN